MASGRDAPLPTPNGTREGKAKLDGNGVLAATGAVLYGPFKVFSACRSAIAKFEEKEIADAESPVEEIALVDGHKSRI